MEENVTEFRIPGEAQNGQVQYNMSSLTIGINNISRRRTRCYATGLQDRGNLHNAFCFTTTYLYPDLP